MMRVSPPLALAVSGLALCLLAAAAFAPAPLVARAQVAAATPRQAPNQTRALWVTRATLSSPDAIRQMVRSADAAGFNTLLVQVRGRGDA